MSTTYFMVVNEKDVEIARTHFNGEEVEVTWVNDLADLLVDEEILMSDSGNQLCETVGDLRELEIPSDAEVIIQLRKELVEVKEEAFEARCAADHFEDELIDLENELADRISAHEVEVKDLEMEIEEEEEATRLWGDEVENLEAELAGAKSFTDDLKQARQELSKALQESLDREAELRKEVRVMKQAEADDTLFEDYTEIREMVAGSGSMWASTHGEFLEVLKDTLESLEDNKSNAVHFRNALEVAHDEAAEARKTIRELERKVLTMNDVVVETFDFTVTIFGEERSDGRGGFFEHNKVGEDFGGGLWFGFDVGNSKYLRDYDGVGILPSQVSDALNQEGISTANIVTTNVNVR